VRDDEAFAMMFGLQLDKERDGYRWREHGKMYDKKVTALLLIDPYNDFISKGGRVSNRLKGVAETTSVFLIRKSSMPRQRWT
jgi:hypothetical protein